MGKTYKGDNAKAAKKAAQARAKTRAGKYAAATAAALCVAFCALVGCIGTKASHQNGVVLYVSTSGQLGLGYGETEDLPGGCTFRREVTSISPSFWGGGTNYTHTVTAWDTRGMVTNSVSSASAATPTNQVSSARE